MSVAAGTGIVTPALTLLGVTTQGETPSTSELSDGVLYLNAMFTNWNADELTTPVISVSGTWNAGVGSDFLGVTSSAFSGYTGAAPSRVLDAFITYTNRDVRIPIQNMEFYRGIGNKILQSTLGPELLVYDPNIADSSAGGTVFVWPVPGANITIRVVFRYAFPTAANASSSLTLSGMATQAAIYNLATLLGPAFGVTVSGEIKKEAADSLARLRNFNASAYNQNPNPPQGQTLPPPAQPGP